MLRFHLARNNSNNNTKYTAVAESHGIGIGGQQYAVSITKPVITELTPLNTHEDETEITSNKEQNGLKNTPVSCQINSQSKD